MRGPKPLQVIRILAFLSLGAAVALTLFTAVAAAVSPGEGTGAAFIRGALEALGYRHESFGAYEAGEVFGSTLFTVLPPLALLFAARTRRLWLLRIAAVLWVLVAAGLGGWTLLPLIAAVLSFLPSVRRSFREEDVDPLVRDVDAIEASRAV